jgi:hypothetical protein
VISSYALVFGLMKLRTKASKKADWSVRLRQFTLLLLWRLLYLRSFLARYIKAVDILIARHFYLIHRTLPWFRDRFNRDSQLTKSSGNLLFKFHITGN